MNAFTNMISILDNLPKPEISKQEYEVFQKEYIFDQLKGLLYGKAFCERFGISDSVVSRLFDEDLAKELIEETYIK